MLNRCFKLLCLAASATLIMACAGQKPSTSRSPFTPVVLPAGEYVQKADSFIVILDGSESMSDAYNGTPKVEIAKELTYRMNVTIPPLPFKAGLRTYGQGSCISNQDSSLIYGMTPYTRAGLDSAVAKVACTGGNTPMENGIEGATGDLKSVPLKKAVVLFSDGIVLDQGPLVAAEKLKAAYGDDVCIYPVLVGNNPGGKALMDQIARIGGCGFSTNGDDISTPESMADFVVKVFLTRAPQPAAKPVQQPAPPAVRGPVDSDGDGVADHLDKCPNTPKGVEVDANGCWVLKDLKFDFDKADIKPQYYPLLNKAVRVLEVNPTIEIVIKGHTDSFGSDAYNKKLSERRAKAVKGYLVSKGIDPRRLTSKGMGETDPVASNKTEEGRAENRRVVFDVTKQ